MKTTEIILREKMASDPQYMLKAAREIVEWESTSVLPCGVVRDLAIEIEHEMRLHHSRALTIAESILKSEFVRLYIATQEKEKGADLLPGSFRGRP